MAATHSANHNGFHSRGQAKPRFTKLPMETPRPKPAMATISFTPWVSTFTHCSRHALNPNKFDALAR